MKEFVPPTILTVLPLILSKAHPSEASLHYKFPEKTLGKDTTASQFVQCNDQVSILMLTDLSVVLGTLDTVNVFSYKLESGSPTLFSNLHWLVICLSSSLVLPLLLDLLTLGCLRAKSLSIFLHYVYTLLSHAIHGS